MEVMRQGQASARLDLPKRGDELRQRRLTSGRMVGVAQLVRAADCRNNQTSKTLEFPGFFLHFIVFRNGPKLSETGVKRVSDTDFC